MDEGKGESLGEEYDIRPRLLMAPASSFPANTLPGKTERDCESRPNEPPTWGRFDMDKNRLTDQRNQAEFLTGEVRPVPDELAGHHQDRSIHPARYP